jgi:hypothetical protein
MAMVGSRVRGSCGSALLALLLWAAPASADDAISEEAKLYFKNGVELIQSQPPNYQDAYYQFKLAWEKSRSWKVLSNWGLCALKLERDGEAIWAYTEYLKQIGKDIDPDERKDLERDLLLLNGNSASVTLGSDIAQLEVVDTRAGSTVPPQSYRLEGGKLALRLRAGSHTLTATSQGKSQRWEVMLSPGRTDEHRFDFAGSTSTAPAPAPAVAAAPATEPQSTADAGPTKSGGTLRSVGYVVTGVGVLAFGGGALMGSQAKGQESDARDECTELPVFGFSCPESSKDDFEKAQQKARTGNVLMIAGGAVALGGLAMIIFGGPKQSDKSSATLQLTPLLGDRDAGLLARGTF